jgi:hypothetical protein
MEEKSIYELELHEMTVFKGVEIMRVPGGWIYSLNNNTYPQSTSKVFVPFDNEFASKKKSGEYPLFGE